MKRQPSKWEKIIANEEDLYFKIRKQQNLQGNKDKINTRESNSEQDFNSVLELIYITYVTQ